VNPLFAGLPTSIFARMSGLAIEHDAVNLGQGFPDFGWPEDVVDQAAALVRSASNQYPPMRGIPALRNAICDHYRHHQGVSYALDEITVTSGATEALAAAILALVSPGDEVLLFQPMYDAYLPMVRRAGGVPRLVRLTPPGWRITAAALDAAIGPKTRLVIFNNPHNPTRACSTRRSFHCSPRPAFAMIWSRSATRCGSISCSTAGRIGRSPPFRNGRTYRQDRLGGQDLLADRLEGGLDRRAAAPCRSGHQRASISRLCDPAQSPGGGRIRPRQGRRYYRGMRSGFQAARDEMISAIGEAGYVTLPAEGTYFVCVDLAASGIPVDDATFCERAVREAGVAAIPVSAFYDNDPATNVIRLCFAKQPATIADGVERLKQGKGALLMGNPVLNFDSSEEAAAVFDGLDLPLDLIGSGDLEARSPIDGRVFGTVSSATPEQVNAAVERAHAAFTEWRLVPPPRRGELVRLFGEVLRENKQALGRLVSLEAGKILQEGLGEVQEMIDICDFAVGLSRQLYGLTIATERPGHRMMETWHPLGVVGVISAFNFPVAVWAWNACLAFVCGDPVVWKPSEKTPVTALAVQALFERAAERFGDAPANLSTLVQGGREVGEALRQPSSSACSSRPPDRPAWAARSHRVSRPRSGALCLSLAATTA
jgi:aspartate/methionine/tyrosine aminotransferase